MYGYAVHVKRFIVEGKTRTESPQLTTGSGPASTRGDNCVNAQRRRVQSRDRGSEGGPDGRTKEQKRLCCNIHERVPVYVLAVPEFLNLRCDSISRLRVQLSHTYRSWLDAAGTAIAVQQKLMRHSDIRTTMNIYGDVVTDEMSQAHSKVVRMALAKQ
jgi:hypothetical protein